MHMIMHIMMQNLLHCGHAAAATLSAAAAAVCHALLT
jgi:hypothetical protein